jgi:hypothetical protein
MNCFLRHLGLALIILASLSCGKSKNPYEAAAPPRDLPAALAVTYSCSKPRDLTLTIKTDKTFSLKSADGKHDSSGKVEVADRSLFLVPSTVNGIPATAADLDDKVELKIGPDDSLSGPGGLNFSPKK